MWENGEGEREGRKEMMRRRRVIGVEEWGGREGRKEGDEEEEGVRCGRMGRERGKEGDEGEEKGEISKRESLIKWGENWVYN